MSTPLRTGELGMEEGASGGGTVPLLRPKSGTPAGRLLLLLVFGLAFSIVLFVVGYVVGYFVHHADQKATPVRPSAQAGYRFAAVAADATECSRIGTEFMGKRGGSAVDAAIATLLCMGLFNCHSMGIGGGFFMTIYDRASRTVHTLNAREAAPQNATTDMFYNAAPSASRVGGLAVAVPGELRGYWEAHQRFGRLRWKTLFEPAITMCKSGFRVTDTLFSAISDNIDWISKNKEAAEIFLDGGKPRSVGSLVRMPRLAETLSIISLQGAAAFYNGSLADTIVSEISSAGGIIQRSDLNNYKVVWNLSISFTLKNMRAVSGNLTMHTLQPPSSGAVLAYILQIMDGYPLPDTQADSEKVLWLHRMAESFKFAYARRLQLGDIDFVHNISQLIDNMTQPWYAELTRQRLDDSRTHSSDYYTDSLFAVDHKSGTAHLALISPAGDAVSVTSTINLRFGARFIGPTTGIIYNNEMDDFSTTNSSNAYGLLPSWANRIEPGKRPLSSMTPAIGVDDRGQVRLIVGAAGGSRISTATALVAARILYLNETVSDAIERPRIHHQLSPNTLFIEPELPQALQDGLESKGHVLQPYHGSVVQGIFVNDAGTIFAHSDSRKAASADGF